MTRARDGRTVRTLAGRRQAGPARPRARPGAPRGCGAGRQIRSPPLQGREPHRRAAEERADFGPSKFGAISSDKSSR